VNPSGTQMAVPIRVTGPSGTSTISSVNYFAYQGPWFVYVVNQGTKSFIPIDSSNNSVKTGVVTGLDVNYEVSISPDGSRAFVTINGSPNDGVVSIDLTKSPPEIISTAPMPAASNPRYVSSVSPDGKYVFVTANGDNKVYSFSVDPNGSLTLVGSFSTSTGPQYLVTSPNGQYLYVVCFGSSAMNSYTIESNGTLTPLVTTGLSGGPTTVSITPDGLFLYAGVVTSNAYDVFSVNPSTGAVTFQSTFSAGGIPSAMIFTPHKLAAGDGYYVGLAPISNNLHAYKINTTTGAPTFLSSTALGISPRDIAIAPDDSTAYITNLSSPYISSVNLTNLPTLDPQVTIPGFSTPIGIAISPDQAPRAAFTSTIGVAGATSTFDGSTSLNPLNALTLGNTPPSSFITSYVWQFDSDPPTASSTSPTTEYTFATDGSHTVSLTVTNYNQTSSSTSQTFSGLSVINNGGPAATIQKTITVPTISSPPETIAENVDLAIQIEQQAQQVTYSQINTDLDQIQVTGILSPSIGTYPDTLNPDIGIGPFEWSSTVPPLWCP